MLFQFVFKFWHQTLQQKFYIQQTFMQFQAIIQNSPDSGSTTQHRVYSLYGSSQRKLTR